MTTVELLALVRASSRDAQAPPRLPWPERLTAQEWCFRPQWLSLQGTAAFEALDDEGRRLLAFHEAVNFFSLNLHGEGPLIAELERRAATGSARWPAYEAHFLDEERKHTGWFLEFCLRYAGRIYPDRKLALPRPAAPGEEELLLFAQALVFEEIVDAYDGRMARDTRLAPIVRRIHALHHRDECRHRAFGRRAVRELSALYAPVWPAEVLARVRDRLQRYLEAVWYDYYNPEVYRDAGFAEPLLLRRQAWECPAQREHRARLLAPIRRFLASCRLLPEAN